MDAPVAASLKITFRHTVANTDVSGVYRDLVY